MSSIMGGLASLLMSSLAQDPQLADPHPIVAGFERFGADDRAEAGRLLIGELNCIACHRSDGAIDAKKAPLLNDAGSRFRPEWLARWIADPHAVKPGTTMPNPRVAKEEVEPLVHYLVSLKSQAATLELAVGAAKGKELFNRLGCAACHAPIGEKIVLTGDKAIVPRGVLKEKYSSPVPLAAFLLDPLKWRPSGRMPKLNLTPQEAMALATMAVGLPPRESDDPGETQPGVAYECYEGSWSKLPDFGSLRSFTAGTTDVLDHRPAKREENYAIRFRGYVEAPRDGVYTFTTHSDDGSRLLIGKSVVVSNDGTHPPQSASGAVSLKKGKHALTVEFFQAGGGAELRVSWEGPGIAAGPIAAMSLSHRTDGQLMVNEGAPSAEKSFTVDPALAKRGREAFLKSCVSCHQIEKTDKAVESKPLLALASAECRGPAFGLNAGQKEAIMAALGRPDAKPTAAERVRRAMLALNCYACHIRDSKGGPEPGRADFFVTTGDDLGEEGRIPPHLTGVGAKLRREWLQTIMSNGTKVRPYMQTRMPVFGAANVGALVEEFEKADLSPDAPAKAVARDSDLIKAGRLLAGTKGMSCVTCHTFNGRKSLGIQGMDLVHMAQRLRREWFGRYLTDPPSLRPGTRMPTFWPDGKSVRQDILGGDASRQIEAIWQFLTEGSKAQTPIGIGPQPIPLEPKDEPIVYRNFIQGAGPRGIGVGYPERVHLAFDAQQIRLALLWQGDFIDASRHWVDRGAGFQVPSGDNLLAMHEGAPFAVLASTQAPWPKETGHAAGYQFEGYELDKKRRPTFEYSFSSGKVQVRDYFEPIGTKPPGFRRTLSFESSEAPENLWFRAAVARKVDRLEDGTFRLENGLRIRFERPEACQARQIGGNTELLVPLRLHGGKLTFVQTYTW